MNEDDFNLTTEQQEVMTDLVEFYNTHKVEFLTFGYKPKQGGYFYAFVGLASHGRETTFYFDESLATPNFEDCFMFLIRRKAKERLFLDDKKTQSFWVGYFLND